MMNWAVRNREQIRNAIFVIGGVMILANLCLGPTPFRGRLVLVALNALILPLAYYGPRWVLKLQIYQHGLRPWIRLYGIGLFYFFGIAAIIAIPITFAAREISPWATAFLLFATAAYSSLATIAPIEGTQNARPAS